MNYRMIAIDEGKQNLLQIDTENTQILWKTDLAEYPTARSLQYLDSEKALVGYDRGYFIVGIDDCRILHDCRKWKGVTSVHRLSDGRTLITGLNLEGKKGVSVVTLDAADKTIEVNVRLGDYVRLMTVLSPQHYLLSTNDHVCETDETLKTLGIFKTQGFLHAWQSMRLETSETVISAGYGAFMAVFDSGGKELKRFGCKEDVPPEVQPFFYASFFRDSQGNFLVANWQDHGPDNGHKGRQLLRFSSQGEYQKSWSFSEEISSLQGLLLIEEGN